MKKLSKKETALLIEIDFAKNLISAIPGMICSYMCHSCSKYRHIPAKKNYIETHNFLFQNIFNTGQKYRNRITPHVL